MTRIKSSTTALLAALVLAFGCALAAVSISSAVAPQKAFANETHLTAGATYLNALDITPKGTAKTVKADGVYIGKSFTTRNLATFNSWNDNHWYKFVTSDRNSSYTITVKVERGDDRPVYIEIYDQDMRNFVSLVDVTSTANNRFTVTFDTAMGDIYRNQTYYVRVFRYAPDSQLSWGTPYVDYRASVTELVPKPESIAPADFTATLYKKSKKIVFNVNNQSFHADGYQFKIWVPRLGEWVSKKFKGTKYSWKDSGIAKSIAAGGSNLKYRVKMRPYRKANGKTIYGSWCTPYTKASKGKYVYNEVTGKYITYKSFKKLRNKALDYAAFIAQYRTTASGKIVRYDEGKKVKVKNK